jgi:hypothetical protein
VNITAIRIAVARVPSLNRVWVALPNSELAAKAAGGKFGVVPQKGFASRDIAPCCTRMRRQVLEASLCGGVRLEQRVLKARNV